MRRSFAVGRNRAGDDYGDSLDRAFGVGGKGYDGNQHGGNQYAGLVYNPTVSLGVESAPGPVIPEPSTFALSPLGLVGLALYGWRRK